MDFFISVFLLLYSLLGIMILGDVVAIRDKRLGNIEKIVSIRNVGE